MENNPRVSFGNRMLPGGTLSSCVALVIGVFGVFSTVAGSYEIWLSSMTWVGLGIAILLGCLVGIVLGIAVNWRGGYPEITVGVALAALGLLVATALLSQIKNQDLQTKARHDQVEQLGHAFRAQANLMTTLEQQIKNGRVQNKDLLDKLVAQQTKIDSLKPGLTKEEVEQATNQAIADHEAKKPQVQTPPKPPLVSIPGAPVNPPPAQGGGDPQQNTPETKEDPKQDPTPSEPPANQDPPSDNSKDDTAKNAFMAALALALAATDLPMGVVLAILALVGQLFSMGTKVEDVKPIVQAVKEIHAKGGLLTPAELKKLVNTAPDPETAAKALQLIMQQPQFRERIPKDALKDLDKWISEMAQPKPEPGNGKPPQPPGKEKEKGQPGTQG